MEAIYSFPFKWKKKFKENNCKKFCDNTQARTGFLHVLHKVVLHNTLLHMCKTCVLLMTFAHYNPWFFGWILPNISWNNSSLHVSGSKSWVEAFSRRFGISVSSKRTFMLTIILVNLWGRKKIIIYTVFLVSFHD